MAVAHVQSTGVQSVGSVNSVSKLFTSNVTAGNLIVAFGVTNVHVIGTGAMTDDLSNTYTRDIVGAAEGPGVAIFSAPNIAGGACTVTFNAATGNDFQSIGISEFSGAATSSVLDGTVTATGNNTAPTGNVTTGSAGVTVGVVSHAGGGTVTIAEGSGYTQGFEDEDTNDMPINTEFQLTAAGTRAVNWTLGSGQTWRMCGAGYKEGVAGETITLDKWRGSQPDFARQARRTIASGFTPPNQVN